MLSKKHHYFVKSISFIFPIILIMFMKTQSSFGYCNIDVTVASGVSEDDAYGHFLCEEYDAFVCKGSDTYIYMQNAIMKVQMGRLH